MGLGAVANVKLVLFRPLSFSPLDICCGGRYEAFTLSFPGKGVIQAALWECGHVIIGTTSDIA